MTLHPHIAADLLLPARTPFDGAGVLRFLRTRAIAGMDRVEDSSYERLCRIGDRVGSIAVEVSEAGVALSVSDPLVRDAAFIADRLRTLFDLDADAEAIGSHLSKDALLRGLLRRRPGVRIAGAWDPFEVCVRAIVGQQVSVVAASTILRRIVEKFGRRVEAAAGELDLLFPEPAVLAEAPTEHLGMPGRRWETIRVLSRAVADDTLRLDRVQELETIIAALVDLPGIGRWTADYIALRGLSHPDAFPAGDLGLRKVVGGGVPLSERELLRRAESWRPWRGYAAMLLWSSLA